MTKPGFRKSRSAGGKTAGGPSTHEGFVSGALFSQAQILHLMKMEFARSRRHKLPLGCMILQVDRLPQLVDLYGAGLRGQVRDALADLVREKTRGADLLGIVNDDRYLLMLPHTDLEGSRVVANRLHAMFRDFEVSVDGRVLELTLSVGLTSCSDQQTMFFDSVLGQAESALEWAQDHGGNQVCTFGETEIRRSMEGVETPPPEEPKP
jgi:diguanylate cyclase (GGDEF)-like protein